jgi:hypothetical protein
VRSAEEEQATDRGEDVLVILSFSGAFLGITKRPICDVFVGDEKSLFNNETTETMSQENDWTLFPRWAHPEPSRMAAVSDNLSQQLPGAFFNRCICRVAVKGRRVREGKDPRIRHVFRELLSQPGVPRPIR